MKKVISLVLAFSILTIPAYAFGSKHHKDKDKHKDLESKVLWEAGFLLEHKEDLALTDEQIAKLETLKLETKKSMIRKDAEIEAISLDIDAKLKTDDATPDAVNALMDQKYELKKEKSKELVAAYFDLKNLLTDEQKAKKKELFKKDSKQDAS